MTNYKINFRLRELKIIFQNIPEKYFDSGLELGAGAGVQTASLFYYCKKLVATEYDKDRFNIPDLISKNDQIVYKICDAEKINEYFSNNTFDLVFSSNMMEHLPNPRMAFNGINKILNKNGVCISTIPSVFMKILYIVFFYPTVLPLYFKTLINKIS